MSLMGPIGDHLGQAMDVVADRHRAIVRNMANINTPGYKAKDVAFDSYMNRAVEIDREGLVTRQDGNNVTMEVERGEMDKNQLAQQLYVELLRHEGRTMRGAIAGRIS